MRRSSVARRSSASIGQKSPAPRPRSAERSMKQPGEGIVFSFEESCSGKSLNSVSYNDQNQIVGGSIPIPHLKSTNTQHDHQHKGNRVRLSSDSSISKIVRSHRRAMSDPFDTADSGGVTDLDDIHSSSHDDDGLIEEEENALPTLQRFPFAATQDKNCWSEPPVGIFHIRGAHYFQNKKKTMAKRYLVRARGCDLFLSDNPGNVMISK